ERQTRRARAGAVEVDAVAVAGALVADGVAEAHADVLRAVDRGEAPKRCVGHADPVAAGAGVAAAQLHIRRVAGEREIDADQRVVRDGGAEADRAGRQFLVDGDAVAHRRAAVAGVVFDLQPDGTGGRRAAGDRRQRPGLRLVVARGRRRREARLA